METIPPTLVSQYLLALDARLSLVEAELGGAAPAAQAANTVFAGPPTGPAAAPAFRALVAADIPVVGAALAAHAAAAESDEDDPPSRRRK